MATVPIGGTQRVIFCVKSCCQRSVRKPLLKTACRNSAAAVAVKVGADDQEETGIAPATNPDADRFLMELENAA